MTTAGGTRGETGEDFNEKGNMVYNEWGCKRKQKGKIHTEDAREDTKSGRP